MDKAITYLKAHQAEDGSWGGKQAVGVTGIVLTGMLETGKVSPKDPVVEKGLKYIESLINTKEGHIAGKDPRQQLKNYCTCVNVLALTSADRDSYKAVVADAVKFLKELAMGRGRGQNSQGRLLRRGRLRQPVAARPVQHAILPRRSDGGRRAQGRPGLQEGR